MFGTSQPRNLIVSMALQRGRGGKQTLLFKITSTYAFIRELNLHILKFHMQDQLTYFLRKYWAAPFQILISKCTDRTLLSREVIILHRVSLLQEN